MPDSEASQPAEGALVMSELDIPPHCPDSKAVAQLAEDATALQGEVNLYIGWMIICGQPVAFELHYVNIKLVDVARTLRDHAQRNAEYETFRQGVRQAEQAADQKAAVNGA